MIVWFADFFRDYRVKPDNDKWNGTREFLSEESVFHATDGISLILTTNGEIIRPDTFELIIIAIANKRTIGVQMRIISTASLNFTQCFIYIYILARSPEGGIVECAFKQPDIEIVVIGGEACR